MRTFELILDGFDGNADSTDHLVKWVSAESREALDAWIDGNDPLCDCVRTISLMDQEGLTAEDGVDFVVGSGSSVELCREWVRESQDALS